MSPASLEELVEAVGAEIDQRAAVLRSSFTVPPAMPPKERLERFARNRRAAVTLLKLRAKLDDLQDAFDRGDSDEVRFVQAMRERGLMSDN